MFELDDDVATTEWFATPKGDSICEVGLSVEADLILCVGNLIAGGGGVRHSNVEIR